MEHDKAKQHRVIVHSYSLTTTASVVARASQDRVGISFHTTERTNYLNLFPYGTATSGEGLTLVAETGVVLITGQLASADWLASMSAATGLLSVIEHYEV